MSELDEILAIRDRMIGMERESQRLLAIQQRAMSDCTHYFRESLQHYTDWLIINGYITTDREPVGAYLDAMGGRSWPRKTMLKARKILEAVVRSNT